MAPTTTPAPGQSVADACKELEAPNTWFKKPRDASVKEQLDKAIKDARDKLIDHARAAMTVEFHTIPLYLYAAYSVIPDHGGPASKARFALLGVVEQEMLHLTLAGNILRALTGTQKLYEKAFVPVYNDETFLLYDEVKLELRCLKKPLLESFIKIESPWEAPHPDLQPDPLNKPGGKMKIAKGYHSIGQFYAEFEEGLKVVAKACPDILRNNAAVQFTPDDFFGDAMTVVQDLDTALKAMKKIIDQGEGSTGEFEESHYNVFLDLHKRRDEWSCFDVPINPTTAGYKHDDYIYRLSLALDAAYCYLLQTIDRVWDTPGVDHDSRVLRQYLMRNIHAIMLDILTPIANLLVELPLAPAPGAAAAPPSAPPPCAAPCFNFYPPSGDNGEGEGAPAPLAPRELFEAINHELRTAMGTARGRANGQKTKVAAILFAMSKLGPVPQGSAAAVAAAEDSMDVDEDM